MKLRLTNLLVLLSFCFSLNATNGIPPRFEVLDFINNSTSYSFNNIFFFDNENELLFVDFEAIADDLVMLNIYREDQLMMEDDVTDLPDNAIYEININIIRKGIYIVELVTIHNIKIRKEVVVE